MENSGSAKLQMHSKFINVRNTFYFTDGLNSFIFITDLCETLG